MKWDYIWWMVNVLDIFANLLLCFHLLLDWLLHWETMNNQQKKTQTAGGQKIASTSYPTHTRPLEYQVHIEHKGRVLGRMQPMNLDTPPMWRCPEGCRRRSMKQSAGFQPNMENRGFPPTFDHLSILFMTHNKKHYCLGVVHFVCLDLWSEAERHSSLF